jgi:hypothetical protein
MPYNKVRLSVILDQTSFQLYTVLGMQNYNIIGLLMDSNTQA